MTISNFEVVEYVKEPLVKGKLYAVPCIVKEENDRIYVTPVINHPHNDKENGQPEIHYHVDYRFVKHNSDGNFPSVINKHSKYSFVHKLRPQKDLHGKLEYFMLPLINEEFTGITPTHFISKSKLKNKCIHKGKCPHRGYDLSQVSPVNGVIQCPLHGLKFNSKTKELIEEVKEN